MLLSGCMLAGAVISLLDGVAGGVIISAALFLAADRSGIGIEAVELIVGIAVVLLAILLISSSLHFLVAPAVAVVSAGALYIVFAAISDFTKEVER